MTDVEWTDEDDVALHLYGMPVDHPTHVIRAFFDALHDETSSLGELTAFVTPESVEGWGDFQLARDFISEGEGVAIATQALRAIGAPDVVFVKLVPDVQETRIHAPGEVQALSWVVLVWRPELGGWRIHSAGDQLDPDTLPRTSPGEAPSVR